MPPTGDLACNPGIYTDWESNQQPSVHGLALNPLSHTSQDFFFRFFLEFIYLFLKRGRKKERGRNINVWLPLVLPTGDLSSNPGMYPRLGIEPTILWFVGWRSFHWATPAMAISFFKKRFSSLIFLERGEGRERGRKRVKHPCMRETLIGLPCLLNAPTWTPGLQPKLVSWPGIKLVTF